MKPTWGSPDGIPSDGSIVESSMRALPSPSGVLLLVSAVSAAALATAVILVQTVILALNQCTNAHCLLVLMRLLFPLVRSSDAYWRQLQAVV